MCLPRTYVAVILSLALVIPALAQPAGTSAEQSSHQALSLLQQSLAVLTGGQSVTDVTLSGTARRIVGSEDESGAATLKAIAGTGARLELSLPSGPRSELRNTSGPKPVGSWSGPDGVQHAISNHNLFTDPGWFPAFTISSLLSAPNAVITYVDPEARDGQSVIHITAFQQFPTSTSLKQHLTQTEIFLDPSTHLPVALAFNTHPDDNVLLDLPVEIRFSDYRPVSSVARGFSLAGASSPLVPFNVQKFLNNSLLLDLQFQYAALNSGLSASNFTVEAGL